MYLLVFCHKKIKLPATADHGPLGSTPSGSVIVQWIHILQCDKHTCPLSLKNKDYLQRETLDPLGLLEHLEHPACVTRSLCSSSMFKAFFNLTY